jgi:tetratricopeptide (TPR) repeat protein
VRRHFGITAFGVNAFTAHDVGGALIDAHDELGSGAGRHEELYFVSCGEAHFRIGAAEVNAVAGTFVFVGDPSIHRSAVAAAAPTTVVAIGGRSGMPFEISPWEYSLAAANAVEGDDWSQAIEIVEVALERFPNNPTLLYSLACFEAQAGSHPAAVEHLELALLLDPRLAKRAASNHDLDSLRNLSPLLRQACLEESIGGLTRGPNLPE